MMFALLLPTSLMIWLAVIAVVILLFGARKLPELAKALGQSKRALKEGLSDSGENIPKNGTSNHNEASLRSVDDETLFEEASRRARIRRE